LNASLVGIGILQAILYLLFVRGIDLYEREAFRYVLPVFVWGFTVSVVVALLFNTLLSITISTIATAQATSFLTAVFVAPVVEEGIKGLGVLLAFLVSILAAGRRRAVEFSGVMDGIVYGSAVGFGFAIAEDLLYFAQFGPETFVVRRIFGGFAHAAFTSLTAVGIGLIPWVRYRALKVLLPLTGLFLAMLLHSIFNLTATLFGPVAYFLMFFVVLVYITLIAVWLAVERRAIREELREEVSVGTISAEEYAILPTYFRRTGYYLGLIFSGHLPTWRHARRVHSAAVDLAFTKRLARNAHTPLQSQRVDGLRLKIDKLRGLSPQAARP
jgi:RsiW-degrading membrane proteinase PrsW (M82 family)